MKFSIGYSLPDVSDSTLQICRDYKDHIAEVYFAWGTEPSGRSPLYSEYGEEDILKTQEYELSEIVNMGIDTALLLNANCYGENAVSFDLKKKSVSLVSYLMEKIRLNSVTTTSPFIARVLKEEFGDGIKIRASVNMWIGTINAAKQLSEHFDGFYLQREYNRDFDKIKELSGWCRENGKTLHMLANSGCLPFCAFHTFHDNIVAHEKKLLKKENYKTGFPSPCWDYLNSMERLDAAAKYLQGSWVRPEDIDNYKPYFDVVKLATRMHSHPRIVVAAYVNRKYPGNIMDLTEPSYTYLLGILDNSLFPEDWFEQTTTCKKQCHKCDYCKNTAKKILRP